MSSLPNKEIGPFSEDEDKALCNQPQKDDEKETKLGSSITTVQPYYVPPHMHNYEESNFEDSKYGHNLDR